ncbi:MAG TPA: adenosine deaminase [Chloroflexota bacterium]|nr:adenosine deaminase [Chloroflexota bacterium]
MPSTLGRAVAALALFVLVTLEMAMPAGSYAAGCSFVGGFAALHDLIPDTVGPCTADERHAPYSGDTIQPTAGGTLIWRQADNVTAFTNGYHTWINGPQGFQQRETGERFSWETPETGWVLDHPRDQNLTPEQRTSRYFDSIRGKPTQLAQFIARMPKGADLHNHLSGAVYAESYVRYAIQDGLCVDQKSFTLTKPPCAPSAGIWPASDALDDRELYDAMVNAWSMRDFQPTSGQSGHDHFFDTMGKFNAATETHAGEMLAEAVSRAAADNVQYVEYMLTPDPGTASALGEQVGWDSDMAATREKLLQAGLADITADARQRLDQMETTMRATLRCDTARAESGCSVRVRYVAQTNRTGTPASVFGQLVANFELAKVDPRLVGVNLVAPEDDRVGLRDYSLHMSMLEFLHDLDPQVNITLHAGELAPGIAPSDALSSHIWEAVVKAGARRIGHGADLMLEHDRYDLLDEMARRKVPVEINLTSSELILELSGLSHPLPMYMRFGVPVTLSTDNQGVSRGGMNKEYTRAASTYGLWYDDLKRLARNGIEYSFLPGASLWERADVFIPVAACSKERPSTTEPSSAGCKAFLDTSEKARQQWRLEASYAAFENGY